MRRGTLIVLLAVVGCSFQDGPRRYQLSGKVTFAGQPLPAGSIMLEPDTAKGNTGPGGTAVVRNGAYMTTPGFGVVGGPYIARIVGYDGKHVPGSDMVDGRELFPERAIEIDLPRGDATHDFDLQPDQRRPPTKGKSAR
jgi:hypothetical protein